MEKVYVGNTIEDVTGYIGNLTEKEKEILDKVKNRVYQNPEVKNNPRFDDQYLLRYCRARQFDFDKIIEMFEAALKWRAENDVDNIYKLDFPKIGEIAQFYPHGYYGVDKKGRPVYIERYTNLDLKKMFAVMPPDEFMKYYTAGYERLVHVIFKEASRAVGRPVERTVAILDCKGFGVTQAVSKKEFLKLAMKISQDYYPEMMAKMFIINTGFSFKALWSIAKPFLDKKTKEKISVLGSSYTKELLEWIDADQLPDFLGGTRKEPLGQLTGPWADKYKRSVSEHTLFLDDKLGGN